MKKCVLGFAVILVAVSAFGQAEGQELPLKKASLFSSGVGYFEHQGTVAPNSSIVLPFNANAVNDALKSLVINDPEASSPQVNYLSEDSLRRALKSLKIDLSGSPTLANILRSLTGAEIQISTSASIVTPVSISGRIVAVENTAGYGRSGDSNEPALSISTSTGIRIISVKDIQSFTFTDPAINADLNKALNLIAASRDSSARHLQIELAGKNRRSISISYVIPTPVWKVSYRLDLNQSKPFLQGWAIIDNDGDTDWVNVELSLVTGRPVSFIQNLYPPYYTRRPTMPLSIAGIADARTYDSGYSDNRLYYDAEPSSTTHLLGSQTSPDTSLAYSEPAMSGVFGLVDGRWALNDDSGSRTLGYSDDSDYSPPRPLPRAPLQGGVLDTMAGASAGDQFEFTLKKPVTLARQQSAMLPLVEGPVLAERTLVFSGQKLSQGVSVHPAISAQITNNTGMKLPAGPITVFDGGTYAGDALVEFIPENEKRIISYGEDLSVSGTKQVAFTHELSSVTVSKGVMTINSKQIFENKYVIRNASSQAKKLIIEHPITPNTKLTLPGKAAEQTANVYRFNMELKANDLVNFSVKEENPAAQSIVLTNLSIEAFLSYSTNGEIPQNVRSALERAIMLKRQTQNEQKLYRDMQDEYNSLATEQERTRKNIEAVGNTTELGTQYLLRLTQQDAQLDSLNEKMQTQRNVMQQTQKAYSDYIDQLAIN
ncbi:MAG: hypothetical protein LBV52_05600 [Spirochaetaceae bacterium]|jgi:hypothetical protein|nr:hypothetical protein [Spirochaetaceae bacterium]